MQGSVKYASHGCGRHGCGSHSERPTLDRDSYVKLVREKVFRPCDQKYHILKKDPDFTSHIHSYPYVCALERQQKTTSSLKHAYSMT